MNDIGINVGISVADVLGYLGRLITRLIQWTTRILRRGRRSRQTPQDEFELDKAKAEYLLDLGASREDLLRALLRVWWDKGSHDPAAPPADGRRSYGGASDWGVGLAAVAPSSPRGRGPGCDHCPFGIHAPDEISQRATANVGGT